MLEQISRSASQFDIRITSQVLASIAFPDPSLIPFILYFHTTVHRFIDLDGVFSDFFRDDCDRRVLQQHRIGSRNQRSQLWHIPIKEGPCWAREIRSEKKQLDLYQPVGVLGSPCLACYRAWFSVPKTLEIPQSVSMYCPLAYWCDQFIYLILQAGVRSHLLKKSRFNDRSLRDFNGFRDFYPDSAETPDRASVLGLPKSYIRPTGEHSRDICGEKIPPRVISFFITSRYLFNKSGQTTVLATILRYLRLVSERSPFD